MSIEKRLEFLVVNIPKLAVVLEKRGHAKGMAREMEKLKGTS